MEPIKNPSPAKIHLGGPAVRSILPTEHLMPIYNRLRRSKFSPGQQMGIATLRAPWLTFVTLLSKFGRLHLECTHFGRFLG
jgi:hypothetical protein